MFFRKKREARRERKKKQADGIRQNYLDGFRAQFDAAVKPGADPAQAFAQLEALNDSLGEKLRSTRESIRDEGFGRWMTVGLAGIYGGVPIATAIAMSSIVFPPGSLMLAGGATLLGGGYLTKKSADRAKKKAAAEEAPFLAALTQLREETRAAADGLLAQKLDGIATSPHFETAARQAPRLRDHVMAAFAKRAAGSQPPPTSDPPPRNGGLKL